jgi:1-acyl-sn-glycerol-3-phosphate acyltransferase
MALLLPGAAEKQAKSQFPFTETWSKSRSAKEQSLGMIFLRSLIFNISFYVLLIVLMILGMPTFLVRRQAVQSWARLWGRLSLVLLDHICGLKVEFRGLEKIPPGAVLIAPKHQSFLETFALLLVIDDFTFVYKRELGSIPFFGWYLRGTEQIAVDRGGRSSSMAQVVKGARKIFAEHRQLIIFPEGTRRPVGATPAYKAGVALIQADTGVVCVPAALNSGLFWPRRHFRRYPGTIVIEFLEPILPGLSKPEFMRVLAERIETATNRLVAEACSKDPSLACPTLAGPASAT